MPDLEIHEGDLEKLSTELRAISEKVGRYIPLPPNLAQVQSAMDGGDACRQAQYAGEHMEDQLTALKKSFGSLSDSIEASAKQFRVTAEINQQSIQQIMASMPDLCPPVGPAKGE